MAWSQREEVSRRSIFLWLELCQVLWGLAGLVDVDGGEGVAGSRLGRRSGSVGVSFVGRDAMKGSMSTSKAAGLRRSEEGPPEVLGTAGEEDGVGERRGRQPCLMDLADSGSWWSPWG